MTRWIVLPASLALLTVCVCDNRATVKPATTNDNFQVVAKFGRDEIKKRIKDYRPPDGYDSAALIVLREPDWERTPYGGPVVQYVATDENHQVL
jgi:hypothetical protein